MISFTYIFTMSLGFGIVAFSMIYKNENVPPRLGMIFVFLSEIGGSMLAKELSWP